MVVNFEVHYMDTRGIFMIVFKSKGDIERDRGMSKVRLYFESNERKKTG